MFKYDPKTNKILFDIKDQVMVNFQDNTERLKKFSTASPTTFENDELPYMSDDIYLLGNTLYYLFSGELCLSQTTLEHALEILKNNPLKKLILRCLWIDRETTEDFENASEVKEEFEKTIYKDESAPKLSEIQKYSYDEVLFPNVGVIVNSE